jgi:hypothetical protein
VTSPPPLFQAEGLVVPVFNFIVSISAASLFCNGRADVLVRGRASRQRGTKKKEKGRRGCARGSWAAGDDLGRCWPDGCDGEAWGDGRGEERLMMTDGHGPDSRGSWADILCDFSVERSAWRQPLPPSGQAD